MKTETFVKKNKSAGDMTIVRNLTHTEEFVLTQEEIDRMERNANTIIAQAQQVIIEQQNKLLQIEDLKKLLK